jgi:hypothetical protein
MGVTMWKPIETAPQDGTVILIRGGNTGEEIYDGDRSLEQRPVTAFYDEGWCVGYWDGDWRTHYEDPTEWCEVPA